MWIRYEAGVDGGGGGGVLVTWCFTPSQPSGLYGRTGEVGWAWGERRRRKDEKSKTYDGI